MVVGPGACGIHWRMTPSTNDETASGGYQDPLERLQVYRLALEAVRIARADAASMGRDLLLRELGGQLLRAASSWSTRWAPRGNASCGTNRPRTPSAASGWSASRRSAACC